MSEKVLLASGKGCLPKRDRFIMAEKPFITKEGYELRPGDVLLVSVDESGRSPSFLIAKIVSKTNRHFGETVSFEVDPSAPESIPFRVLRPLPSTSTRNVGAPWSVATFEGSAKSTERFFST